MFSIKKIAVALSIILKTIDKFLDHLNKRKHRIIKHQGRKKKKKTKGKQGKKRRTKKRKSHR